VTPTVKKLCGFCGNLYLIALFATAETNNFPGSKMYRNFRGEEKYFTVVPRLQKIIKIVEKKEFLNIL
jgi:hypothetical protein